MRLLSAIQAIADPTRFEILRLVRKQELPAGAIADRFDITRPAVSQHLRVLKRAGLVSERRVGTRRLYRTRMEGFEKLRAYLEGFWDPRLNELKRAAESAERRKKKP